MTWPFGDLRPLAYNAILADPPWDYENWSEAGEGKNPKAHYDCMSLDAIKALPVSHLAQRNCLLKIWAMAPMVPHTLEVMRAWNFRFVTMGTWAKQSSTGRKWAFGTGYVLRGAAEFWIIGRIGNPVLRSKSVRNLIVAPVREHSRKPDEQYEVIERLVDGPYVELFSKTSRDGWDSWGNQVGTWHADRRAA